jgi:hypothetical protein
MPLYPKISDNKEENVDDKKKINDESSSRAANPVESRKCQDLIFLILFVIFWIGMFIVAGLAIKSGNLQR